MLTVLFGVVGFTVVMLALVSLLLLARTVLVPSGPVNIVVNSGERDFQARAGDTLLTTLTSAGILLPSACGGRGTCGVCRVQVVEGGGGLLPTETAHISRGEAQEGWRLACQVKVKESISLAIPSEIFAVRRWQTTVRSNKNVATFIREIVLELHEGEEIAFRAGGYIQVECPPYECRFTDFDIGEQYRSDWDKYDLWRLASSNRETVTRAYSMANYPEERGVIILNVRIATPPPNEPDAPPGVVSSYLFNLKAGDEVTITGPFGEFFAKETDREMVFIGGGAGMAPMRSHILDQLERINTTRQISFWYGARSLQEAFYVDEFDRLASQHPNFEWHLALSEPLEADHWTGPTGFIHEVVYRQHLENHPTPEGVEYYLCGPPMMIKACQKMLDDLGVPPGSVMFDDFGI